VVSSAESRNDGCRAARAAPLCTFAYVFHAISRWALAPVFQLLDIRREPGLSPFGYQFVSLEDTCRCAYLSQRALEGRLRVPQNPQLQPACCVCLRLGHRAMAQRTE